MPDSNQEIDKKTVKQTIFGEEANFNYADFEDLKNNEYYDRFLAGQLNCPTGKIVCTDPLYRELGFPQSWSLAKGQYPVYIYIGLEEDFEGRVAYAELVIKDEIPDHWEFSLIPEEQLSNNFEKKMNGMYPVESGLSCFADYETYKRYDQEVTAHNASDTSANYYRDKLGKLFLASDSTKASSRRAD